MSINVTAMTKSRMIELFDKYIESYRKYFGSEIIHNLCGRLILTEEALEDKELYKAVDHSLFTMSNSMNKVRSVPNEELDSVERYALRSFELAMRDIYIRLYFSDKEVAQ